MPQIIDIELESHPVFNNIIKDNVRFNITQLNDITTFIETFYDGKYGKNIKFGTNEYFYYIGVYSIYKCIDGVKECYCGITKKLELIDVILYIKNDGTEYFQEFIHGHSDECLENILEYRKKK
jgi:hypothetical protein